MVLSDSDLPKKDRKSESSQIVRGKSRRHRGQRKNLDFDNDSSSSSSSDEDDSDSGMLMDGGNSPAQTGSAPGMVVDLSTPTSSEDGDSSTE